MASPILRSASLDGQRIGLFGGSFNPPHDGHLAVALTALARLRLDRVWWLVSPQNPLKDPRDTQDFAERLAATRSLARHPRFLVSDIETRLGTRTTAEALGALGPLLARGRFVWIMGADSFAGLHRWNDWREIPAALPLAVIDRPGWSLRALHSPAARTLAAFQLREERAAALPGHRPPAWAFLTQRHRSESSTAIRAENGAVVSRMSHASS